MILLTYGRTFTPVAADDAVAGYRWVQACAQAEQMGGELLPGPPCLVELEPLRGGMRELALAWPIVREVRR